MARAPGTPPENTTTTPAYLWDYRTSDNYNNRGQMLRAKVKALEAHDEASVRRAEEEVAKAKEA